MFVKWAAAQKFYLINKDNQDNWPLQYKIYSILLKMLFYIKKINNIQNSDNDIAFNADVYQTQTLNLS